MATVLVLVAAGACEDAAGPGETPSDGEGELGAWVQAQGRSRTYRLHQPPGWDGTSPIPVVVALHGASQSGAQFRALTGLDPHADRLGFLAVYPDGVEATWSVECGGCFAAEAEGVDDLAFLQTLLDHLEDHLPVDRDRVYLLGYSNGGMLAGLAACRGRPSVAGIGSVAAPLAAGASQGCAPPPTLRAAHVHGDADPLLPWEGRTGSWPWLSVPGTLELWAGAAGCDASPTVTLARGEAGVPGSVERWDWEGCGPGDVRAWRVEAGGHGWFVPTGPDTGIDATEVVIDFLWGSAGQGAGAGT